MSAKHTPGPWKAKGSNGKYDNRQNSWTVCDEDAGCSEAAPITLEDGTVVAFAVARAENYFSDDRTDANATLIAAAPELLEALCLAHDHLALGWEGFNGEPNAELKLIRAAIDKAIGAA